MQFTGVTKNLYEKLQLSVLDKNIKHMVECSMKFQREECEQVESVRYTCSRDPTHNWKDISTKGKFFFQKQVDIQANKKKKGHDTKKRRKSVAICTGVWLYLQGLT